MDEYKGSTEYLYFWDPVYGWMHVTETEKLVEAKARFDKEMKELEALKK